MKFEALDFENFEFNNSNILTILIICKYRASKVLELKASGALAFQASLKFSALSWKSRQPRILSFKILKFKILESNLILYQIATVSSQEFEYQGSIDATKTTNNSNFKFPNQRYRSKKKKKRRSEKLDNKKKKNTLSRIYKISIDKNYKLTSF